MNPTAVLIAQLRLHAAIEDGDRGTASSLLASNFASCDISVDRPLGRDEWLDVAVALRLRWRPVDEIEVSDTGIGVTLVSGLFSMGAVWSRPGLQQLVDLWAPQETGWVLLVRRERPIPVHPSVGP